MQPNCCAYRSYYSRSRSPRDHAPYHSWGRYNNRQSFVQSRTPSPSRRHYSNRRYAPREDESLSSSDSDEYMVPSKVCQPCRAPSAIPRYAGFVHPCLQKRIQTFPVYYAKREQNSHRRHPSPPPQPPAHSCCTCSCTSYSYEDEDTSEDLCSCACYEDDLQSDEDTVSVYDSVAEDTYCKCSTTNSRKVEAEVCRGRSQHVSRSVTRNLDKQGIEQVSERSNECSCKFQNIQDKPGPDMDTGITTKCDPGCINSPRLTRMSNNDPMLSRLYQHLSKKPCKPASMSPNQSCCTAKVSLKSSCDYCKQLLKKLQQHEEEHHSHSGPKNETIDDDKIESCMCSDCACKKTEPQKLSQQASPSESNQDANSTGSPSKESIAESDVLLDVQLSDTMISPSNSKTCMDNRCKAVIKNLTFDDLVVTPKDTKASPKLADQTKQKHCLNPNCGHNDNSITSEQTYYQFKTQVNKSEGAKPSISEIPAIKEQVKLKEYPFRPFARSGNVLGPQKRAPIPYYPSHTQKTFNTNYLFKRTSAPTGTTPQVKHLEPPADKTEDVSVSGIEKRSEPQNVFFASSRLPSALPPVEEVSKEDSETVSDSASSQLEIKCEEAEIEEAKGDGNSLLTSEVGVQYPSSLQMQSARKKEKLIPTNPPTKLELPRGDFRTACVTKSRRCLVHSYPLKNRHVSPNRTTPSKM